MNIVYTWQILGVFTYQEYEGIEDVIYACQWQITGTDQDTENSAWVYDTTGFTINVDVPVIPRSQVTDADIIGWVQTDLGPAKIADLEAQIAQMLAPPIVA
jgi:hypothetical protein